MPKQMSEKAKKKLMAPCSYLVWNDAKNRDELVAPPVDCKMECHKCGWNPAVMERRLHPPKRPPKVIIKQKVFTDAWGLPKWQASW